MWRETATRLFLMTPWRPPSFPPFQVWRSFTNHYVYAY